MNARDPLEVIQRHWNSRPVPIEAIIADMGLEYRLQALDDEISGYIERKAEGLYLIVVNALHPKTRQRFTAAHELAHYIYHRDLLGDGVGDNRAYRARDGARPNPNIQPVHERQANSFAANVLMPRHALADVGDRSTEALAREFGVSREVMLIRLGRPRE